MCTGKFVRSFCPEAIAANPLCPHFDPICQGMTPHAQLWMQTKFVCCGSHFGDCVQCPLLYYPGNIAYQDGTAAECPKCSKRLRKLRAGKETAETVMRPTLVEGEDTYVLVPAEREDADMADSEGDSEGGSEGGSEEGSEGDSDSSEASRNSSGSSHVSDSDNVEMTDADFESVVDEDNMTAEFDIVCGCKDCMKE